MEPDICYCIRKSLCKTIWQTYNCISRDNFRRLHIQFKTNISLMHITWIELLYCMSWWQTSVIGHFVMFELCSIIFNASLHHTYGKKEEEIMHINLCISGCIALYKIFWQTNTTHLVLEFHVQCGNVDLMYYVHQSPSHLANFKVLG